MIQQLLKHSGLLIVRRDKLGMFKVMSSQLFCVLRCVTYYRYSNILDMCTSLMILTLGLSKVKSVIDIVEMK